MSAAVRISAAGVGAWLLDVGAERVCLATQQRLWSLAAPGSALRAAPWFSECVVGVNNLLLVFDALRAEPAAARAQLLQCWQDSADQLQDQAGATHEIAVDYDLSDTGDLAAIAEHTGRSRQQVVQLHSGAEYRVACVGSMPGFAYLVGLPQALATPRRARPRAAMPRGGVIIGGAQAGIMPCTAPSGWHLLGATEVDAFDPLRAVPCLFAPGDRVLFRAREVRP